MSDKKEISVQFPILGLLGVLFVGLKLTKVIDWSWWWVTLPFWGGAAALVSLFLLYLLLLVGAGIWKGFSRPSGRVPY